jgi:hypothetical protein
VFACGRLKHRSVGRETEILSQISRLDWSEPVSA